MKPWYELRKKNIYRLEYLMTEREGIEINMNRGHRGSAGEQIKNKLNMCLNAYVLENIESNVFHK